MSDTQDLNDPDSTDATNPIVRRAHKRWRKCWDWNSTAYANWGKDLKFANGDEYNNYQYPEGMTSEGGERADRVNLTVNETRQHNLHIINEAKQNKAEVKYRPTGGGATAESADVYEGMYRHIANISNAQMAQGQAIGFQVQAGLGWTIVEADYVEASPKPGADAFNQEIYIRGIEEPLSVMLDCDASPIDGSGARYGFVFRDRPKDEVIEKYPKLKFKLATANAVDGEDAGWVREDHVRECTYYEVTEDKDELLGDDEGTITFASKVPNELIKQWEAEHEDRGSKLKRRPIIRKSVKAHLIIGNDLIETNNLPGTMVPLVPWVGEITVIDQQLDRKGHTRAMLSPQRMINYNFSAGVEFGALQTKVPWLVPVATIEEFETYYGSANVVNHAFLPWKDRDDEGNERQKPERMQPPTGAPVYAEGIQTARMFMQAASGQYDAEMGRPGNEKSGKAINERQRASERATYHFTDNQALAIRRQGVIVKEWIPVIYDTERVAKIINVKGEEEEVLIKPDAEAAHHVKQMGDAIQRIFNPRIGSYEVVSDVGPDFATQRQETFNAVVEILKFAPALADKIADLLFKSADFPLADEIAERLKPGLSPEAIALQEQLRVANDKGMNTEKLLREAMQALTEERIKAKNDSNEAVVKAFNADTQRQKMLLDTAKEIDPAAAIAMIRELMGTVTHQTLQDDLGPVIGGLTEEVTRETPEGVEGAGGALPIRVPDLGRQAAMVGGA